MYAQVAWAQSCANHVQHIERLSRASVIFELFYWLNHWTDEGEEETGVPGENPWQQASENPTYQPEGSSPKRDSNLCNSIRGRLGKQMC